ncbi:MAG: hypothetical protein ACYTDU_11180 [Planctomycetota bacterium]
MNKKEQVMKHIAIALVLLATLAIEARAQDLDGGWLEDYAGTPGAQGLGIDRMIYAHVDAGPTPHAHIGMRLWPNVLGRSFENLSLDVRADGAFGAYLHLGLAGVSVADETGPHIDVDLPSARGSQTEDVFLAMVGARLVSFDITVTAEMDLDLEATGRSRRVFLDRRGRIFDTTPAFSRIDGTAQATIFGSVDVHTRGAYARYALKFFDGALTAKNLSANERWVLVSPGEGAWVVIEPVSMYIYLMARPYRRLLVRAVAPRKDKGLVWREWPV